MVSALDVIEHFAPAAKAVYRQAFADPDGLIAAVEIDRPRRLAHFMAQCLHETGGGTILVESGRYSAKNLGDMWDSGNWHRYFRDRDECVAMARQCQIDNGVALFSRVYGNRMGNGGPDTQDGWTFRGRGVLQTTGRGAYRDFGNRCGVDFEGDPDLVVDAHHALKPALLEWRDKNVNDAADHDDIEAVTLAINGGLVGLKSRRTWLARILPFVLGQQAVEQSREWRIQVALARAGYDPGKPDGVVGPRTRLAIIAYRADHGLAPGPQIADDLVSALGV